MTRKEFEELTAEEQWQWVIDNKEQITQIDLDNDCTYVVADCFKVPDEPECTGSISMKSWLGNGHGLYDLFDALGIKCEGV